MAIIQRKKQPGRGFATQTKISPSFQTTISVAAVRALKLRPGMKLTQTVEGNRLILEPLQDVDALAGSLGTGRISVTVEEQNKRAKSSIARAAMKGLHAHD
jgi:hypothetical protein